MDYRSDTDYPRGMRNNNAGNLTGTGWIGQVGSDAAFAIFSDMSYGLRALCKDLTTAINDDGDNTITTLITHYAPPSENDTASYITNVALGVGKSPDDTIDVSDDIFSLMRAIITQEQGAEYSAMISDDDIENGIEMAQGGIIGDITSFVAANPEISVAAGIGVTVLIIVIILVATKKLNLQTIKDRIFGTFK